MKRTHKQSSAAGGGGSTSMAAPPMEMAGGKAKTAAAVEREKKGTVEEEEVDELLAVLGYKVRSSDMADVAQKLEQLDMAMAVSTSTSGGAADADDFAFLSDSVHYNPSDLSTWLDSMLSDLNTPPPPPTGHVYGSDPPEDHYREHKRMRTSSSPSIAPPLAAPVPALPVMVVDPQEAGIRLVHALMACAEAVHRENLSAAAALVRQIPAMATSQGGAMSKVAGYFADALARRVYGAASPSLHSPLDSTFSSLLYTHFYESCPYLKFAHFTADQAILEAFSGYKRVHVIDFGMRQGMQWPALMQALALRPGGPPSFRLTGIGPPSPENGDPLQEVGWKLAQFAETINVDFHYRGFVAASLADLEPYMLAGESGDSASSSAGDEAEAVAVNSVCELHQLLARPGAIEKVLETVRTIRPRILTVVEQEANHNNGSFVDRFTEALHYYSTMFDSLEGTGTGSVEPVGSDSVAAQTDQVMTEMYLGREICNVVASEGSERTERHETLDRWRDRFGQAGFEPVHLGSNAFRQASTLLALFAGGDGYRVEERDGCLTLGWHTRPLIATSAWRVAGI